MSYYNGERIEDEFPEKKYPIVGYAPGTYQCKCSTCGQIFIGDKLAIQCEPCAVQRRNESELALEAVDFYWRAVTKMISGTELGDIERKNYEKLEQDLKKYLLKYRQ